MVWRRATPSHCSAACFGTSVERFQRGLQLASAPNTAFATRSRARRSSPGYRAVKGLRWRAPLREDRRSGRRARRRQLQVQRNRIEKALAIRSGKVPPRSCGARRDRFPRSGCARCEVIAVLAAHRRFGRVHRRWRKSFIVMRRQFGASVSGIRCRSFTRRTAACISSRRLFSPARC
jgi:hypothetical protein